MKYLIKYLNGWLIWRKRLFNVFIVRAFFYLLGGLSLLACSSDDSLWAPVSEDYYQNADTQDYYTVRAGDSLYSIAWAYGLDYRDLAAANGLKEPYGVSLGKRLRVKSVRLASSPTRREVKNHPLAAIKKIPSPLAREGGPQGRKGGVHPSPALRAPFPARGEGNIESTEVPSALKKAKKEGDIKNTLITSSGSWLWPTQGKVASRFVASATSMASNKGIDIQGVLGQAIKATAAGKVVYSGSGVRGYGNLIIIKHDKNYLSAYAYNQKLLVKEEDSVTAGQIIAEMGKAETGRVLLHFEIRYNGQPVDPMIYLNRQGKS